MAIYPANLVIVVWSQVQKYGLALQEKIAQAALRMSE